MEGKETQLRVEEREPLNRAEAQQRGYLNRNFQLFHLRDALDQSFAYHYHEFDKIIFFLSGKVTYLIEGKTYRLKPWDVLLIHRHDIHKPIIDPSEPYERIVLWLDGQFLEAHSRPDYDLTTCFALANQRSVNLVRADAEAQTRLRGLLSQLSRALTSDAFASELYANTLFLQLIILMNRIMLENQNLSPTEDCGGDERIAAVLRHINANLSEELRLEQLAAQFYLSRSHLMSLFKKETGFTVHAYVLQKRLLTAAELIRGGMPVQEAAARCGFAEYSTFARAFKKLFGHSASEERQGG